MAKVPVPVFRISGAGGIVVALYVLAIFGTLHLVAISRPESRFAKTLLALGF